MVEDKTIREFIGAIKGDPEIPSTTQTGVVSRIDEEGTVWVYLSGSDRETPTAANASEVKRGDAVNVEWRNNRLYISGNYTDPSAGSERVRAIQDSALQAADAAGRALVAADSAEQSAASAQENAAIAKATTDEINNYADSVSKTVTKVLADGETAGTAAQEAKDAAQAAQNGLKSVVQGATTVEKAVSVMQTALEAVVDYDPQNDTTTEYFWHDANGAHVLGTSGDYRNDVKSTGMEIVDTSAEKAVSKFGADGAVVGVETESRLEIKNDRMSAYNEDSVKFFDVDYGGGTTVNSADIVSDVAMTKSWYSDVSPEYSNPFPVNDRTAVRTSPLVIDVSKCPAGGQISVSFSMDVRTTEIFATVTKTATNCSIISDPDDTEGFLATGSTQFTSGTSGSFTAQVVATNYSYYHTIWELEIVYDGTEISYNEYLTADHGLDQNNYNFPSSYNYFTSKMEAEWSITTHAPSFTLGTNGSTSSGSWSSRIGENLIAEHDNQTAVGKFNDNQSTNALEIGNGTADNARSNALTVDWSGNVEAAGDIEDGSGNVLADKVSLSSLADIVYPVGSIYMSVNNVSPQTIFTGTTWVPIQDRFLLSAGTTYTAGSTGGSPDAIVPYHRHGLGQLTTTDNDKSHTHAPSGNGTHFLSRNSGEGSQSRIRLNSNSSGSYYTWATDSSHVNGLLSATATGNQSQNHQHKLTPGQYTNYEPSGGSGNANGANMPPYLTVYMWKRTA